MSTPEEKVIRIARLSRHISQVIIQAGDAHRFMQTTTWQHLPSEAKDAYRTDLANLEFKLWAMLRDRMALEVELNKEVTG